MEAVYNSIDVVESAITEKLKLITGHMSIHEISDMTAFIREAKHLRDALISLDYCDEEKPETFDYNDYSDVSGEDFVNAYLQACDLLITLYKLIDDQKVKEHKSEWIFEELRDFMDMSRAAFGPKVPELPTMRLVSNKPKKIKKSK